MSKIDTSAALGLVISDGVVRTISGEMVHGIPVFAYSEDVDTGFLGVVNRFCRHWSTPGKAAQNVQRLFAEDHVRTLIAERDALRAEVERLWAALQASVAFADGVANELDIEMAETVFTVRVMPKGEEVAARSWASVQAEARAALKGGDA